MQFKVNYGRRFSSDDYIFQHKFVELGGFGKIAWKKPDRVEFRIIENMRFQQNGRGDIQPLANIGEITEKL